MRNEIYWIEAVWPGRLGIARRPRGGDWLEGDVRAWRAEGVGTAVCLLTDEELRELDLGEEAEACAAHGMEFRQLPIPDRGLPSSGDDVDHLIRDLHARVEAGPNVIVHCRQGIGRSSLIVGSALVAAGDAPDVALDRIERVRGCHVPDTEEQRQWLRDFAETRRRRDAI